MNEQTSNGYLRIMPELTEKEKKGISKPIRWYHELWHLLTFLFRKSSWRD